MKYNGYTLKKIISEDRIQKRVKELASELSKKFSKEIPIFIGVLNGSFIFMADLLRYLKIGCEMDFIKLSSYKDKGSTGTVRLLKDISAEITDRHVVIIEDIIDSGLTIEFLKKRIQGASPRSVTITTLLFKPDVSKLNFPIDLIGFEIPPHFVVGYGLDYNQKLRHLPAIYRLEQ